MMHSAFDRLESDAAVMEFHDFYEKYKNKYPYCGVWWWTLHDHAKLTKEITKIRKEVGDG